MRYRLLLACCVATTLHAAQQPASSRITEARISPDGQSIAFARESAPGGLPLGLFRIDFGGQSETSITVTEAAAFPWRSQLQPSDVKLVIRDATILFATPVADRRQSVTLTNGRDTWIDLIGPDDARVTVMPPGLARIVAPPSWSDDGARFAVIGSPSEGGQEIFAGLLPRPQPTGPNMGAVPPRVRQITGLPR